MFLAEQFTIGVKYASFQVLRETTQRPSALLELGFLSNGRRQDTMESTAVLLIMRCY
ncbi:hypothetical protein D1013_09035 [Euzebyella marina]|uniref:Uncharacterized protein n=1 Tax=Euzebyella marina TaxID=1761453 RepID=A0A3G2L5L9_9FLAO|nr:hypothetical protein D1013_09035 [Euzebyella marina]